MNLSVARQPLPIVPYFGSKRPDRVAVGKLIDLERATRFLYPKRMAWLMAISATQHKLATLARYVSLRTETIPLSP